MSMEPITVRIAEPIDVSFYLNASADEWAAMMATRYGPYWQYDDDIYNASVDVGIARFEAGKGEIA